MIFKVDVLSPFKGVFQLFIDLLPYTGVGFVLSLFYLRWMFLKRGRALVVVGMGNFGVVVGVVGVGVWSYYVGLIPSVGIVLIVMILGFLFFVNKIGKELWNFDSHVRPLAFSFGIPEGSYTWSYLFLRKGLWSLIYNFILFQFAISFTMWMAFVLCLRFLDTIMWLFVIFVLLGILHGIRDYAILKKC